MKSGHFGSGFQKFRCFLSRPLSQKWTHWVGKISQWCSPILLVCLCNHSSDKGGALPSSMAPAIPTASSQNRKWCHHNLPSTWANGYARTGWAEGIYWVICSRHYTCFGISVAWQEQQQKSFPHPEVQGWTEGKWEGIQEWILVWQGSKLSSRLKHAFRGP